MAAAVGAVLALSVAPSLAANAVKPAHRTTAHALAWHPHIHDAKRYAKSRAGYVQFAVIGLDGEMRHLDGGTTAPMASTFKVMLLATYLRQHSVRHRDLTNSDKALLDPMIRRSDNVAATRVRDIVGVDAIKRLARDANMRDFSYNSVWGLSRTSSRDQANFMHNLEHFIPPKHRHYALRLLSSIVPSQSWGIGEVHMHGWKLFFKGGWGSGTGAVDHQVALVKSHGHRISLAILTESDPSHDYGKATLRGVARRLLKGIPHARRLAP